MARFEDEDSLPRRRLGGGGRTKRLTRHMKRKRIVAILVTPGVQLLDVSGPLDVFAEANVQTGAEVYQPLVIGSVSGAIRSSSGVRLMPEPRTTFRIADNIGPAPFWQLIEQGVTIAIECDACHWQTRWTPEQIEGRFRRHRSKSLNFIASKLRCHRCNSQFVHIWPVAGHIPLPNPDRAGFGDTHDRYKVTR